MAKIGSSFDSGIDTATSKATGFYLNQQAKELQIIAAYSEKIGLRKTEKKIVIVLGATFFDSGSTNLNVDVELERIGDVLVKYKKTFLSIEGHTDSSGSESYNQKISKLRAIAVQIFLVKKGVGSERARALGYGETNPIFKEDLKNRRVEIVISVI